MLFKFSLIFFKMQDVDPLAKQGILLKGRKFIKASKTKRRIYNLNYFRKFCNERLFWFEVQIDVNGKRGIVKIQNQSTFLGRKLQMRRS
jgi:hypothetical protein